MPDPQLSEAELSARYGFAMAVLNSDPELKSLFQRAVAQTYTGERFLAELRATNWFKNNSDHARNYELMKASDPKTLQNRINQVRTRMMMMAAELGAAIPSSEVDTLANHFLKYAQDDNQMRATLSQYVKFTDGRMLGQAGQWEQELRAYASDMGVSLSDSTIESYVKSAVGGQTTFADAMRNVQQMAISANPHLADRLQAGETLATIADPYRQSMSKLLEVNPESVTLEDPTIRKALQAKDEDGKVVLRTLYDFENDLRQDKRWLKTKNAQDNAMSVTNRVLKDLGVIS